MYVDKYIHIEFPCGLPFHMTTPASIQVVYKKNMEFRRGRNNGWFVLAVCSDQDDSDDCEAFSLEVACKVIGDTPQADETMVIWEG